MPKSGVHGARKKNFGIRQYYGGKGFKGKGPEIEEKPKKRDGLPADEFRDTLAPKEKVDEFNRELGGRQVPTNGLLGQRRRKGNGRKTKRVVTPGHSVLRGIERNSHWGGNGTKKEVEESAGDIAAVSGIKGGGGLDT